MTPTSPQGVMARLKAGTAAQHAVAESKPLEAALIDGSIGQSQYQKYLGQRWLIHRELESATDRAHKIDSRLASLNLSSLYQTKNLEADLAQLKTNLNSIQPLPGAQAEKSPIVFISAGTTDVDGYEYVIPPNGPRGQWSTAKWTKDSDPSSYGYVAARFDGKAVAAFLDGSVRVMSLDDLRDMRFWSKNAAINNDRNSHGDLLRV